MADKNVKVQYDLDFNHRGVAALNGQLARTTGLIGSVRRGGGGLGGNLYAMSQVVSGIAQGMRRAAIAATGFGVALGYVVRQASNLEKKQRGLQTLIPGSSLQNFIPAGHKAGQFNPLIFNTAQDLGVSTRKGRDFLSFLSAQSFPMSHLGKGTNQRINAFRMMAGMQGTGADVIGIARALAQISASDRFMAQEFNQLINAGVPVKDITGLTKLDLDRNIRGQEKYDAVQKIVDFYRGELTLADGRNLKTLVDQQVNTLDGATINAVNSLHDLSEALGRVANRGDRVTKLLHIFADQTTKVARTVDASNLQSPHMSTIYAAGQGTWAALQTAITTTVIGTIIHMLTAPKALSFGSYARGVLAGTARYTGFGMIGAIGGSMIGQSVGGDEGSLLGGVLGGAGTVFAASALSNYAAYGSGRRGHPSGIYGSWMGDKIRGHRVGGPGTMPVGFGMGGLMSAFAILTTSTLLAANALGGFANRAVDGEMAGKTDNLTFADNLFQLFSSGRWIEDIKGKELKVVIEMKENAKMAGLKAAVQDNMGDYEGALVP